MIEGSRVGAIKFWDWVRRKDARGSASIERPKQADNSSGALVGQTAIVTGASGNIGSTIARAMASGGANVVVHYHKNRRAAEALAGEIVAAGGVALPMQADIRSMSEVQTLTDSVLDRFGQIDILVNNTGVVKDKLLIMMSDADWGDVLDVNLSGTFNCCKCVVPHMKARKYGRIVNIGSITGMVPQKMRANYGASKRAMFGLTKCLARELASFNITVNLVAPQVVKGGLSRHASAHELAALAQYTPVGGLAENTDVAHATAFLVGGGSRFITGTALNLTGGLITWQL